MLTLIAPDIATITIHPMPNVVALVARALVDTDFLGELAGIDTDREMLRAATIATDQAAEEWEHANGLPIGATVTSAIRCQVAMALIEHGWKHLRTVELAAELRQSRIDDGVWDFHAEMCGRPQ